MRSVVDKLHRCSPCLVVWPYSANKELAFSPTDSILRPVICFLVAPHAQNDRIAQLERSLQDSWNSRPRSQAIDLAEHIVADVADGQCAKTSGRGSFSPDRSKPPDMDDSRTNLMTTSLPTNSALHRSVDWWCTVLTTYSQVAMLSTACVVDKQ